MEKQLLLSPKKTVLAWILGIFSVFAICISVYAAAGRCVPCRANHYCPLGGIPYLCPADKPVTSGTGHDAQSDCMSCATRNGSGQPFFGGYQLGEGYECISCLENDLTTPVWNGSACVSCATANPDTPVWNNGACEACPTNTTWDGTAGECVAENTFPELADAYLVTGAPNSVYNGIYKKTDSTSHEVAIYSNGTNYLMYQNQTDNNGTYTGSYWYFRSDINETITPSYYKDLSGGASAVDDFASPEGTCTDLDGGKGPNVYIYFKCIFEIPHGEKTLCLVESAPSDLFQQPANEDYNLTDYGFGYISNTEEDDEFIEKYGIGSKYTSAEEDYWAGAMKYCQDKGLRLATMDELVSVKNAIYGTNDTCSTYCGGESSNKTGCCDYYALTATNQELVDFLGMLGVSSWSSEKYDSNFVYYRDFSLDSYAATEDRHRLLNVLCLREK